MKTALLVLLSFFFAATAMAEPASKILFEEGHGQRFHAGTDGDLDLSLLAGQMRQHGATVGKIDEVSMATLTGAAALVVSGPFQPFTAPEIAAIVAFVEGGGRLAIMLHIGPPVASLLAPLGVYHSNGVVRESSDILEEQPLNFTVRNLAAHPLFAGIESFAVFGTWALDAQDKTTIVARSGAQAWVNLNRDKTKSTLDAVDAFGLVVAGTRGKGQFVVFGDDAIFQNRYLHAYNDALGDRLARWLKGEI